MSKEACIPLNHFLRDRVPDGKWTSLAVILNPHRDMGNMIVPNFVIALERFTEAESVEDDMGTSPDEVVINKQNSIAASTLTAFSAAPMKIR